MKQYYDPEFKEALMNVHADINRKAFLSPRGKLVAYSYVQEGVPNENFLSLDEIINAVFTLQKVGAIKVVKEYPSRYRSGDPDTWDIELIQPRFDDFLGELLVTDNKPDWFFPTMDGITDIDSKKSLKIYPQGSEFEFTSSKGETKKAVVSPGSNEHNILLFLITNSRQGFETTQLVDRLKSPRRGAEESDPKQRVLNVITALRSKLGEEVIDTTPNGYKIDYEIIKV